MSLMKNVNMKRFTDTLRNMKTVKFCLLETEGVRHSAHYNPGDCSGQEDTVFLLHTHTHTHTHTIIPSFLAA